MSEKSFQTIFNEIFSESELTQIEFADKLGVAQGQVSDWLNGKNLPSYYHLRNMCIKLEIPPERLLGLEDY